MSRRRRRTRTIDPLAHPNAIRGLLARIEKRLPDDVPKNETDLVKMLRAASHCERRGWTTSPRGRPARYDRTGLSRLWNVLTDELANGAHPSISPRTFTEHYLRLLTCPSEAIDALADGRINLFEALQLSRLTPQATKMSTSAAAKLRVRILASHVASRGSAKQLYERINELLGTKTTSSTSASARSVFRSGSDDPDDELDPETDAYLSDPSALFSDQIRLIAVEIARIDSEKISEADTSAILDLLDQLYLRVSRTARKTQE